MVFDKKSLTEGTIITLRNGNRYLWNEKQKCGIGINTNGIILMSEFDNDLKVISNLPSICEQFDIVKISKNNFTYWEREEENGGN